MLAPVFEAVLRAVSVVTSAFVLLGFGLFATDQVREASERTRDQIAGIERADPTAAQERARERAHSRPREVIDDVNDALLSPFAGVTSSDNRWVHRGVPALLALLVYGFGLGFLARFTKGLP